MKKQIDDKTCVHACLAMIVDEPVEYVVDWFDGVAPLCGEDMIVFLAHHGIYFAVYAKALDDHFTLTREHDIDMSIHLEGHAAFLTVKSERFKGKVHQVFWTGYEVLDPSPLVDGPRDISSYKITEVWPCLLTPQRLEGFKRRACDD